MPRRIAPRDQCELERVAQAVVFDGLVGGRVWLLPVGRGIDIAAAGDDQAVEAVQHPLGDVGVHRLRRQQHRDAAGQGDPFEVDGGQKAGAHIPHTGLRLLQIGGQPDDRSGLRDPPSLLAKAAQSRAPSPNRSPRS